MQVADTTLDRGDAGTVELDDPPVVLEVDALYASTDIAA